MPDFDNDRVGEYKGAHEKLRDSHGPFSCRLVVSGAGRFLRKS